MAEPWTPELLTGSRVAWNTFGPLAVAGGVEAMGVEADVIGPSPIAATATGLPPAAADAACVGPAAIAEGDGETGVAPGIGKTVGVTTPPVGGAVVPTAGTPTPKAVTGPVAGSGAVDAPNKPCAVTGMVDGPAAPTAVTVEPRGMLNVEAMPGLGTMALPGAPRDVPLNPAVPLTSGAAVGMTGVIPDTVDEPISA